MSHSLETKIQVVILMTKYESPIMIIRELQRRGTTNIPERYAIISIYQKFLETGSIGDLAHTGRPSTIAEHKVQEIQQVLDNEAVNSVQSVVWKANVSRYQARQIMEDFIGYKPYMMQCSTITWWRYGLTCGNVGTPDTDSWRSKKWR